MKYSFERAVAIEAVIKASTLCREVQSGIKSSESIIKEDNSPVTAADFGSQAIINLELLNYFPADRIMAEEDSLKLRSSDELRANVVGRVKKLMNGISEEDVLNAIDSGTFRGCRKGRYWVIDPIDGTKGFLRGDQYAVAVGLIEDAEVVVGVLGCPNLPWDFSESSSKRGCIVFAVKGQGAYIRSYTDAGEKQIRVSSIRAPQNARFLESVESGHSSHNQSAEIGGILGITAPPLRIDSQCKYAVVARGDVPIYLRFPPKPDYRENTWDHAAGSIIVEEAGGKITDLNGHGLDFSAGRKLFNNQNIIVTNGVLHDAVLNAARKISG